MWGGATEEGGEAAWSGHEKAGEEGSVCGEVGLVGKKGQKEEEVREQAVCSQFGRAEEC